MSTSKAVIYLVLVANVTGSGNGQPKELQSCNLPWPYPAGLGHSSPSPQWPLSPDGPPNPTTVKQEWKPALLLTARLILFHTTIQDDKVETILSLIKN